MQRGSDVIIADTSCLILLDKIYALELLNSLAKEVYVTLIIQQEFGKKLPNWILFSEPRNEHYQEILEMGIDEGEASAIALALHKENSILILDDLKGRRIAERLNLRYSGTFGLILRAKQEGVIEKVKPLLDSIKRTNFRI